MRLRILGITAALAASALAAAPAASARSALPAAHPATASSLGTTTVTTAPGIATTLLGAGVLPLPVLPDTGFGIGLEGGSIVASYAFPIVLNTANLTTGHGRVRHSGGINFVGLGKSLEIGKFSINVGAAKIYAREINYAKGRVPVLDVDLSGLHVVTTSSGDTLLSGIVLRLDPAAAGVLNSTFGLGLPTDGSLVFATATVLLKA